MEPRDVPEDIAALPEVAGFGNVYSLHQVMLRDNWKNTEWRIAA